MEDIRGALQSRINDRSASIGVIGLGYVGLPMCIELAYQSITQKVVRVSSKSAEMVKLLENTFRAINIGMVNEVAIMCDKL